MGEGSGTVVSPYRGFIGGPVEVCLSTGDIERWLKWALGLGRFPVWEIFQRNLEGMVPSWGPWRIGSRGFMDRYLFP